MALIILMVAAGQIAGMRRGYICDHGSFTRETRAEHCHRDSSKESNPYSACEMDAAELCESKGEKTRHAPATESLQSPPASGTAFLVPPFVAVLLVEQWDLRRMLRSALKLNAAPQNKLLLGEVPFQELAKAKAAQRMVMLV